jgi:pyruvoyl-dependent arginine decarboxylase (PvlArgDC)
MSPQSPSAGSIVRTVSDVIRNATNERESEMSRAIAYWLYLDTHVSSILSNPVLCCNATQCGNHAHRAAQVDSAVPIPAVTVPAVTIP